MSAIPRGGASDRSMVMIDGYEQLPSSMQWLVRSAARARGVTLVVTAHESPSHFDVVWRTYIDREIEEYVLSRMILEHSAIELEEILNSNAWAASRALHGQNLRESLFDMYDWYRDQVDGRRRQR
jgi:hypothetical protein